eukprot:TRINITY_DN40738_c0_g1_i1.p1 TRINITY_DN40738_c0_g1~~TRINITY_DN40738_c0_g1_i1.p1  ORF type:complete len:682 (+),score=56.37 TRINITY_DN40738_c0_g1_i1:151-2046(+)
MVTTRNRLVRRSRWCGFVGPCMLFLALTGCFRLFLETRGGQQAVLQPRSSDNGTSAPLRETRAAQVGTLKPQSQKQNIGSGPSLSKIKSKVSSKKDACPVDLGDFASSQAMSSAGWKIDVADKFFGSAFSGWGASMNTGSLRTSFKTSGLAILIFGNDHADKSAANNVQVRLNKSLLGKAGPQEERLVCFQFKKGDMLEISEVYGMIRLKSLTIDCSGVNSNARVPDSQRGFDATPNCTNDQAVWTASPVSGCNLEPNTYHGLVESVLTKTKFLVQVHGFVRNEGVRKVVSAPQLTDVPSPGSLVKVKISHCAPSTNSSVGVVVLADAQHAESYKEQILSLYCYAAKHGYDMWHLSMRAFPKCARFGREFFFQKHCVVSEFLAQRRPGYTAVVVDGDVVAAVQERGLEQWINYDADVQLYERAAGAEIAAGNYIVRNTPWAREWLIGWANRMSRIPKGYSSADNGALHVHVIETLQLNKSDICVKKYSKLVADVTNLGPYFDFVNCAKGLLGPPRKWRVSGGAHLVIWPKLHFFVVDGMYLNSRGSNSGGPVFHHGYKARAWEATAVHRTYYRDLPRCKLDHSRLKSTRDLGLLASGHVSKHMKSCVLSFSCKPLGPDDPPKRNRACGMCS